MTEDSAPLPVKSAGGTDHIHPDHLRKEGWTMALYVAICLIAALTALANVIAIPGHIMGMVWGATVGLAVARGAERSRIRSILFGLAVLVAAFAVAALKHALTGH
jgi:hypothetical protein